MEPRDEPRGIAIVGMACRFPGANSVGAFWANLCDGVESIRFFSDDELRAAGVDASLLHEPGYVKAAPVLEGADTFDAAFFEYSPREAVLMDPQHRLFLEVAREAFDDAGYHAESYDGIAGVFAGGGGIVTSYLVAHPGHPALIGQTASIPHIGNDKDFLATRVSYKLNLTGPSITVQTACSTSLVAVHLGCQSLMSGESDMVLAGAATVRTPQVNGYLAEKGHVHSLDGRCRPFDAAGTGTIFGSGVAAVLLKRLADAIRDGDHVYAVIKATAVNNDGGQKVSYTAPSVHGQARAMVEALALADTPPDTIQYVECHATGTVVGDPLEIQALTRAFRTGTDRVGFCAVGSVKGNIGHPEQAAGLAGLIKTALALRHRHIPVTVHLATPNPSIDFAQSPFFPTTKALAWPAVPGPRRAAVNSLGIGGTNAFAILEEAPALRTPEAPSPDRLPHLFTLSAKSPAALARYAARVRVFLDEQPNAPIDDLCFTSNVSRSPLPCRLALTVGSVDDLRDELRRVTAHEPTEGSAPVTVDQPAPVFLFSGQGSQYAGMAAGLYRAHPVFRDALDECDAILRPHLERPLFDVLWATGRDGSLIDETGWTQPALFVVEWGLARLWQAWGIRPAAVMGHSVGELVAACVAGAMDLKDGLLLVAERGRLMQSLPRNGAMAAVGAPEDAVERAIAGSRRRLAIAAINGPRNTVISGDRGALADACARLRSLGFAVTDLPVSHAFHSPLLDRILDAYEERAASIAYREPALPLISNVTGKPLGHAPDGRYWRDHARFAVRCADGFRTLQALGHTCFMEIGPGSAMLGMGRSTLPNASALWLASLARDKADWQTVTETLRHLYLAGAAIDWKQVSRGGTARRMPLPTYPFQAKRFWLDAAAPAPSAPPPPPVHPLLGPRADANGEIRFDSAFDLERCPYLADHRIAGAMVLPTAAAIESILAAGRAALGGATPELDDVVYHEALVLVPGQGVQITLAPETSGRIPFQIASSVTGTNASRIHLSGVVQRANDRDRDEPRADRRTPEPTGRRIAVDRFYADLRARGIDYGPAFRGLRDLRRSRREVVATVSLPSHVDGGGHSIHPVLLDACLHAYLTLVDDGPLDGIHLPVGFERFRLFRDVGVDARVRIVVTRDGAGRDELLADVRIHDGSGRPAAVIDGLRLRRLPLDSLGRSAHPVRERVYHVRWEPRERAQSAAREPGRVIIFADSGGVGQALAGRLKEHGVESALVETGPRFKRLSRQRWSIDHRRPEDMERLLREVTALGTGGVRGAVFLWALDSASLATLTPRRLEESETATVGGAFHVSRALEAARESGIFHGRLWLVTRNAQRVGETRAPTEALQAMLWGFGRTVSVEAPALWGGLADLPARSSPRADAAALADELLSHQEDDQVAWRDGKRFVARLDRLPPDRAPRTPIRIRGDATYVITGGLGMLGLRVARWLVETQGARSLVLTSRRGPNDRAREAIDRLETLGARVLVVRADVSVERDVRTLFAALRPLPPLAGVIHGAGVLDDGILARMTWPQFARVTAPKIKGAFLLHRHTRHMALDLFLLHSSLLSVTGSPGQANYTAANAFLDGLVAHRRALGLTAIAINWGPWDEDGMARASGARGELIWKNRGVRFIAPDDGIAALADLLRDPVDQAAIADVDWPAFAEQHARRSRFYDALARDAAPARPATVQPAHANSDRAGDGRLPRRAVVVDLARREVMRELGFEETIDSRQPLNELGLDSLMAVNLANRLETSLGVAVPIVKLIRGPSIEQLVDELFPDLAGLPPSSIEPAAPDGARRAAVIKAASPARTGNAWLVVPRPNPTARLRLFCFPFAGGGAATYRPWADKLPKDVELVAIEPPGRASRIDEPPIARFEPFVAALADAMRPFLDRPSAFFGHCWGGLTAFETAGRLLRDGGLDCVHLFVSGSRPPHRLSSEGPFERNLLESLLAREDFDPLRPLHEQGDDVFAEAIRHFNIGATTDFLARPALRRVLLPAVRADFEMATSYRFEPAPPWDVPITAFAGLADPYAAREDTAAWNEYTRRSFRLHLRAGAHFLIVEDRDFIVDTIGRELTA